jgi:hypothetical protein
VNDNAETKNKHTGRAHSALLYVRERDQWSHRLEQLRTDAYRDELGQLQHQLARVEAERDAARRAVDSIINQRNFVRQEAETLAASLDASTLQLEGYRRQLESERNAVREDMQAIVSERDQARREAENLQLSLAEANTWRAVQRQQHELVAEVAASNRPALRIPLQVMALGGAFLATAALVTTVSFHDAQSSLTTALVGQPVETWVRETLTAADTRKPPKDPGQSKTRFARLKESEHKQWGPSLLLPEADASTAVQRFSPLVQQEQRDLLTLGFEIGKADGFRGARTRQALHEFSELYLSASGRALSDKEIAVILGNYASMARADADRFGIDRGVVAAIRLGSIRSGVDFSYLMQLAAVESNFDPQVSATGSSATGLYQFTRDTWLNAIKRYGARYGLGEYADKISFAETNNGYRRPVVSDAVVYQHLLALRNNPRVSAMMVAEAVHDDELRLGGVLKRKPGAADLYLSHFLGAEGAVTFLKVLDASPDTFAVDMFPAAAQVNQNIFHPQTCNPRTVDEVYALFGAKFKSSRFDELAAN